MRDQILELIKQKPKHFSKLIKSNQLLNQWVLKNTLVVSNNYSEMVYSSVYQQPAICENGNKKKFESINTGYVGCGPAAVCQCTREKVSRKVKESKSLETTEQKESANLKRKRTNLEKYGVECVAQTEQNRQKFRDWYADPENVRKNLERIRATNLEKYGVENCKSLPEVEEKIIATCLSRYGVKNVAQIPSTKAKLRARTAEYKMTGHLIRKGYDRFKKHIETTYSLELETTKDQYQGVEKTTCIQIRCAVCGNRETVKFHYNKDLKCRSCFPRIPSFTSKEEQAVFDYISQELEIRGGIQGDRTLVNPYELDMIFPDQRIAVEYCGLYWHSESSSGKGKNYHRDKLCMVNDQGYRLITIFSDEWNSKQSVVKSKLANIFRKTTVRHYARNLIVKTVPDSESKKFQDVYHLQGASSSKINLGLYNNSQLVSLMTFANSRAALNSKGTNADYELVRFVTNGSSVVGGASKLLKYFIKTYNPKSIVSYSDCRWSQGDLYEKLGFEKMPNPTIGYWYVDDYTTRLHRFNFTKQELVRAGNDPQLTEWEIMQSLGYDRIWDCGHQKFVLRF